MEERPLECSQCKKRAAIVYQEILGRQITTSHMCTSCPILKKKLEGQRESPSQSQDLCCSSCQTTLENLLLGYPLGCKDCYQIFQDVLVEQLLASHQIPSKFETKSLGKASLFHVGATPEANQQEQNSTRLSTLNEALSDALHRENYEEAAWLRDQIKQVMENTHEPS